MSESKYHTFYLLDLDRTLFDTVTAARVILEVIAAHDEGMAEKIRARLDEFTSFGVSFAIRDAIVEYSDEATALAIEKEYIEEAQQKTLLLPGAQELIDWIQQKDNASFGILTFGSLQGQTMKIKGQQLDQYPYLVTDKMYKGALMASWYSESDGFILPSEYGSVRAEYLVLVDDRLQSFEGLPEKARGYWITAEVSTALDSIPASPRVSLAKTLAAVISAEQRRS